MPGIYNANSKKIMNNIGLIGVLKWKILNKRNLHLKEG